MTLLQVNVLLRLILELAGRCIGRTDSGWASTLPFPIRLRPVEVDADGMELLKRKGCIPQPAPDWSYQFAGNATAHTAAS